MKKWQYFEMRGLICLCGYGSIESSDMKTVFVGYFLLSVIGLFTSLFLEEK